MAKTSERSRSAITGQFVSMSYAANNPGTTSESWPSKAQKIT